MGASSWRPVESLKLLPKFFADQSNLLLCVNKIKTAALASEDGCTPRWSFRCPRLWKKWMGRGQGQDVSPSVSSRPDAPGCHCVLVNPISEVSVRVGRGEADSSLGHENSLDYPGAAEDGSVIRSAEGVLCYQCVSTPVEPVCCTGVFNITHTQTGALIPGSKGHGSWLGHSGLQGINPSPLWLGQTGWTPMKVQYRRLH